MNKTLKTILIFSLGVLVTVGLVLVPWQDLANKVGFDPFRTNVPSSLKANCLVGSCRVYIDGQDKGETPVELIDITPGKHTVKIEKLSSTPDFYTDISREIEFLKGTEVYMEWELGPSELFSQGYTVSFKDRNHDTESVLSISSELSDISVSIDGVNAGSVPYLAGQDDLSTGSHKLTFSKSGYLDREIELDINYKYATQVEVDLMAKPI